MSHFAVLVIMGEIDLKSTDFRETLDSIMAPYMENCCAEPERKYMEFYDVEEEYRKQYEEEKPEYIVVGKELVSPYDSRWTPKASKTDPFPKPKVPDDLPRRNVDWSEIYPTFEQFIEEYAGYKKDPELGRYGYWQNGEKTIHTICLGSKAQIVHDVPNYDSRRAILSGKEAARPWNYEVSLLPVQVLSEEAQQGKTDTRTKAQMVLEREIWDYLGTISVTPEGTKRIMSNLQETSIEPYSSGSRSQDGKDKRTSPRPVQFDARYGARQYRATSCGNPLPHKAHVIDTYTFGGAKWDWFEIGGRWSGYFKMKPGVKGLQGKQYNFHSEFKKSDRADVCFKCDVDVESMRKESGDRAAKKWDWVNEAVKDTPPCKSWEEVKEEYDLKQEGEIEKARKAYWDQPRVKKFKQWADKQFQDKTEAGEYIDFFEGPDEFQVDRQLYIQKARNHALTPFAVIRNGKWYEHGRMGWWGIVSDEKDPETWDSMFSQMFDQLSDDTLLCLVDCHI